MTNNESLRLLMEAHHLTRPKIAGLLGCSLGRVDKWLCPEDSSSYRQMDGALLELLTIKVGAK